MYSHLEHCPYKAEVTGSNPVAPTRLNVEKTMIIARFITGLFCWDMGHMWTDWPKKWPRLCSNIDIYRLLLQVIVAFSNYLFLKGFGKF